MPSQIELLRIAEEFLQSRGIVAARLDAEWLLAHILNCERLQLRLGGGIEICEPMLSEFWKALRRRANREPLQYIIGEVEFYGLALEVNENVLIPRQETEELVAEVVARMKNKTIGSILDLGTGSGAIGLSLAKSFPGANMLATDISEEALSIAAKNAARNKIQNIAFLASDWFEKIRGKFDLIISNPPYLSSEELQGAEEEVRKFEPELALVAANDGLKNIFTVISCAGNFLKQSGLLAMETGISQHGRIEKFAKKYFQNFEAARDLSGKDRFVFLGRSLSRNST
jgi:release factor glutamine methyltransferase